MSASAGPGQATPSDLGVFKILVTPMLIMSMHFHLCPCIEPPQLLALVDVHQVAFLCRSCL